MYQEARHAQQPCRAPVPAHHTLAWPSAANKLSADWPSSSSAPHQPGLVGKALLVRQCEHNLCGALRSVGGICLKSCGTAQHLASTPGVGQCRVAVAD